MVNSYIYYINFLQKFVNTFLKKEEYFLLSFSNEYNL
nr:MAG TPA: hypothetical protein [Caudoviricetes sp.]